MPLLKFIFHSNNSPLFWLYNKLSRRQFFMLSGIFIGFLSGGAAILLKAVVHYIHQFVTNSSFSNSYKLILLCSPLLGLVFTVLIVRYLLKGKLGKGISNILYEIAQKSSFVPRDKTYSQILTSSVTVGFGGSAGLESPIVVTGSAIGSNYARFFNLSYKERTVLLAAGAAAGIAAAFNAPIAGIMFAIEIILPDIIVAEMIPIIISAVCGALCSKIFLQDGILFFFKLKQSFDYHNVPFYIFLGIFLGFLSLYYSKMTHKIEALFERFKTKYFLRAIFGGTILGIMCLLFPALYGEGYWSIGLLADGKPEGLVDSTLLDLDSGNHYILLFFIGIIMLIKVIATSITLAGGGNGGNFAPTLFVGSFAGFFFSRSVNLSNLHTLPESNFTIVGMAGVLSGVMHAPLTAIFLIAEITGGYELMIPLMIVSSLSFLISKHFEPYSMDNKKLALKGLIFTANKDRNILSQINIHKLIDRSVFTVEAEDSLRDLVYLVRNHQASMFAVVNAEGSLKGVINLDRLREVMFNQQLYDTMKVKQLMKYPKKTINIEDDITSVLKKFDTCRDWHLPVVEGERYIGFISKSKIHIEYRAQLLKQLGEMEPSND